MPNPTIQHLLGSAPNISLNSHSCLSKYWQHFSLLREHQIPSVSQSSRFILPITSQHLLFKFQITVLGFHSVPAILGVYSLHLPLRHLIGVLLVSCMHIHASRAYICTCININVLGQIIGVIHIRQYYHWSANYRSNDIVKIIHDFRDHANCWKQRSKERYEKN